MESDEGKATLAPLLQFNRRQNKTSSAMIVVFGDMRCYEYADRIYGEAAKRGIRPSLVAKAQMTVAASAYKKFSRSRMNDIVKIDSSLFAMQFMLVARSHGYDTNPIGGFDQDKVAEAFGLDVERYVPVLIMSIGKAATEGHESVRLPAEDLVWWR